MCNGGNVSHGRVLALIFLLSSTCYGATSNEAATLGLDGEVTQRKKVLSVVAAMKSAYSALDPGGAGFKLRFTQGIWNAGPDGSLPDRPEIFRECELKRKQNLVYIHTIEDVNYGKDHVDEWYSYDGQVCVFKVLNNIQIYGFLLPQIHSLMKYNDLVFVDSHKMLGEKGLPGGYVFALPDMVSQNSYKYKLQENLETVDDQLCIVLDWANTDKIWVDKESYIVRRRNLMLDGHLYGEFYNSKFINVQPGISLPSVCTVVEHVLPGQRRGQPAGSIVSKQKVTLLEIDLGDLNENDFQLRIPPNEQYYVLDTVRKMGYRRYPEGVDPIAASLSEARKVVPSTNNRRYWLVLAILIGTALQVYFISLWRAAGVTKSKRYFISSFRGLASSFYRSWGLRGWENRGRVFCRRRSP